MSAGDLDLVHRAYTLATGPRVRAITDDHHPAYLHAGRVVLVLLQDVGQVPADVLAAAAVHETEDPELRVSSEAVRGALGAAVADLVDALPLPGDKRLLECLVTLGEGARLSALAERLDQVRHLHLRQDLAPRWRAHHEEVGAVWLPVADRTHSRLADRFRHWHRAFARRVR